LDGTQKRIAEQRKGGENFYAQRNKIKIRTPEWTHNDEKNEKAEKKSESNNNKNSNNNGMEEKEKK